MQICTEATVVQPSQRRHVGRLFNHIMSLIVRTVKRSIVSGLNGVSVSFNYHYSNLDSVTEEKSLHSQSDLISCWRNQFNREKILSRQSIHRLVCVNFK